MLTRILTITGAFVCITLGVARAQPAAPAADAARGRTIFETRCATCHGMDGRGGQAPGIARGSNAAASTDDRLRRVIREGSPAGMPGVGKTMSSADINAVILHVRELQHAGDGAVSAKPAEAVPGDADAGRTLFFGAASCAQCHMAEGRGGFLASDLTHTRLNAQALRQAIRSPDASATARNALTTLKINRHTLKGLVRNEDNFTIQFQDDHGVFHSIDKSSIDSRTLDPRPLMPTDYGTRLSDADIQNLVRYLTQLASR